MAGPWERYQAVAADAGPWDKFKPKAASEDWERAVLLPMETNKGTGERRLAWPQIAVDIGNAMTAPGKAARGEYNEVLADPETGVVEPFNRQMMGDAASLAAIPTMGATGGITREAVNVAAGALPSRSRSVVMRALKDDRVPVNEIGARLQEIGPDAVMADLGPRLQKQAQAIATMPGQGQKTVIDALRMRAAGRDSRIMGDVDSTLGPATTPTKFAAGVKEGQSALSPFYEKAFAEGRAVDSSPIALTLESLAVNTRGEAQDIAKKLRGMLNVAGTDQLDPAPQTLFEVRKAIDGMFDTVHDGNARRILGATRKQVDEMLGEAVPGIKAIDEAFAQLAKRKEAFDTGQTVLDSGRTALRPPEVQSMVEAATPDVLNGLSQGARAEIDRIIGTTANDLTALKRALGGEGDWNRARLASVFGQEKADKLLKVVERELRYKALEDDALAGSRTQVLRAAQEEIAGKEPKQGVIQSLLNLKPGDAAAAGADKGLGWWSRGRRAASNAAIADALMSRDAADVGKRLAGNGPAFAPEAVNATARGSLLERDRLRAVIEALRAR